MRRWFMAIFLFISLHGYSTDLFDAAVLLIKKYEGWHHSRGQPYVGYGHRLLATDTFGHDISESLADSLLRSDLKKKCAVFRCFNKDSLLLGVLSFNVGENKVLRSKLVRKLKAGDRNIREEYLSFCHYKGQVLRSLKRRRKEEYELLKSNVE